MELTLNRRATDKKSETKRIRRDGHIPTILYSKGEKGEEFFIDGIEFKKILNKIEPGMLSTTHFTLKVDGKEVHALVKDIQYHITTYNVIHIDFLELHPKVPVSVKVPIVYTDALECEGVKLGGFLRSVIRQVEVRCLPADLPSHFEINVREMQIGQAKKLRAITFPQGVRPKAGLNEVAVVIAKR